MDEKRHLYKVFWFILLMLVGLAIGDFEKNRTQEPPVAVVADVKQLLLLHAALPCSMEKGGQFEPVMVLTGEEMVRIGSRKHGDWRGICVSSGYQSIFLGNLFGQKHYIFVKYV